MSVLFSLIKINGICNYLVILLHNIANNMKKDNGPIVHRGGDSCHIGGDDCHTGRDDCHIGGDVGGKGRCIISEHT